LVTSPHGETTQKTIIDIDIAVRTSNPIKCSNDMLYLT
jgi:hypothetical protein